MGQRKKIKLQPRISAMVEAAMNLDKIEANARKRPQFQEPHLFADAVLQGLGQVEGGTLDPEIVRTAIVTAYVMGNLNK